MRQGRRPLLAVTATCRGARSPFLFVVTCCAVAVLLFGVAADAAHHEATCAATGAWNASAESHLVRGLFFDNVGPAFAGIPGGSSCRSQLCSTCWGASGGCNASAPASTTPCKDESCINGFLKCQAAGPDRTVDMRTAVLDASVATNVTTTTLYRGCRFALCFLEDVYGTPAGGGGSGFCPIANESASAPDVHHASCSYVLDWVLRTRTQTMSHDAPTPAPTPPPLPTVPVPSVIPANAFDFMATTGRTTAGRDQLASVLSTFATTQVRSVLRDPTGAPRQVSVTVNVDALDLPQSWLATVTTVTIGGSVTASELAILLGQRLSDAVSDGPAQPTAFAAAGITLNRAPEGPPQAFPNIADSSATTVSDGLLPLWAAALAVIVSGGFGAIIGALLIRTACKVEEGPPLSERLKGGSEPRSPNDAGGYVEMH